MSNCFLQLVAHLNPMVSLVTVQETRNKLCCNSSHVQYITWLWLDVFLVLLNGDVLVGVVAFDSVCVCVGRVWLFVKSGQVG